MTKKTSTMKYGLEKEKICFVISPIGKVGTPIYKKFKDVLEYLIKPAIKESGYDIKVIRADDIKKPGSFIKDIFNLIFKSYLVIADLTGQNPNVFYELGVRHSLKTRTILIAEDYKWIPSDLKEYRALEYSNSEKGIKKFKLDIRECLNQIHEDLNQIDNPVLEKLGQIHYLDNYKNIKYNFEKKFMINSIEPNLFSNRAERFFKRNRIFKNLSGRVFLGNKTILLSPRIGKFELHLKMDINISSIESIFYIATISYEYSDYEEYFYHRLILTEFVNVLEHFDAVRCNIVHVENFKSFTIDYSRKENFFSMLKSKMKIPKTCNVNVFRWGDSFFESLEKKNID